MVDPNVRELPEDPQRYFDALKGWGYDEKIVRAQGLDVLSARLLGKVFGANPASFSGSMLDLGAGTGATIEAAKKHGQPSSITAVDLSPRMLEGLEEKFDGEEITIIEASIEDFLEGNSAEYDLITMMSTAELIPNLPALLGKIPNALRRNGLFAFTYVPVPEDGEREARNDSEAIGAAIREYFWPPAEIETALEDGGLAVVYKKEPAMTYVKEFNDERPDIQMAYNFLVAQKP